MKTSPAVLGLIRGLGYPIGTLILTYFSVSDNIASLGVSASVAVVIAAIISTLEHSIEGRTGKALFGAARAA